MLNGPMKSTSVLAQSSLPQTNLSPIQPPSLTPSPGGTPAGSAFNQPPAMFDPYSPTAPVAPLSSLGLPSAAPSNTLTPGMSGNPRYPNGGLLNGLFSGSLFQGDAAPAGYPNSLGLTPGAAPYAAPPIYNYGPPAASVPTIPNDPFPSSAYPSGAPSTLFPGGVFSPGGYSAPPGFAAPTFAQGTLFPAGLLETFSAYRFLQGPRLRHTFISGGDGLDVGLNQTDVSVGFAWNNFLFSNRPLFVVPSFSLYLFDGPQTPPPGPPMSLIARPDLPPSAYGGFLDFGWQSDPNQILGAEFGVRVGAFTDFDNFNDDSLRVLGKGLLSLRLTPATTLKGGVYYLDRHSIGILPAGGLLWQPNPFTRADIFFPEPKFARYCRTIGTQDVWWYLAGEFGGDSWTVTRARTGAVERVDLNQINVMLGWEWGRSDLLRRGQRTAFFEVGYVFDREFDYEDTIDDFDPGDAFLVRAGFGY